ncbi:carboxypeptidase A [Magnaporthiopsis poae ATCC 64411]|uniref:Carboxypeptidase A n=1 Tax=Magnaporthiopsis poae (strain ATCC 64411 / 73-15) TaxID=644358 RepID=A0A0C4E5Q9_MAGP6|nr:carboxypeptidase A [Magnaporthiopsis poae ATCC 64411]
MKLLSALAAASAPLLTSACLLPEERTGSASRLVGRRQASANNGIPVGSGDRFNGGTVVPRGLGTRPAGTSYGSLLSVQEIESGFQALATTYGFETFNAPFKTYEGRTVFGGRIGGANGTCSDAYRVFINAAIHARERGASDGLLYFVSDLLYADKNNVGVTYGRKSYTAADVKKALSAGLVFIPLSNPDGVAYDQASNSCWRKNRNPKSSIKGVPDSIGVDLNRNFDFLWDFQKTFAPSAASSVASTNPSDETFHGTAPFSEPETQNLKWVLDTYSKVRWFIDLHSYTGDVLFSWGSDTNQDEYPYMNFLNSSYNSVRGIVGDTPGVDNGYGEYVPVDEDALSQGAAKRIGAGMSGAVGRAYTIQQSSALYPTSGASDDYAYSRHFVNPGLNRVHSYTIEFGFGNNAVSCPFYPSFSQYNANLKEIASGFMEMLLAATDLGLGEPTKC